MRLSRVIRSISPGLTRFRFVFWLLTNFRPNKGQPCCFKARSEGFIMQRAASVGQNLYRKALKTRRRTLVIVGLFSAIINVLMLTGPIYMLQIYDRVLSSGSIPTLQGLFIVVVILYVFLGFYQFLRARLMSRAAYRLDQDLGERAMTFWMQEGVDDRPQRHSPVRDLGMVRSFMSSPALLGVFDLPWIPLFLIVIFAIHPWLGYLTVAGAGIMIAAAILNQMLTKGATAASAQGEATEQEFLEASRRNAAAIMTQGMKDAVVARWRQLHDAALAKGQEGVDRTEFFSSFSRSFRLLLQSALLTVGAYLALQQEITPGMIIATSIIAGRALAPVDQVLGQWSAISRGMAAHKRLLAAFDAMPEEKRALTLPEPKGRLSVSGLIKLMPPQSHIKGRQRILNEVSFELSPGDGLGVIGNSAAGKSSLAKLLVGAWRPDAGDVRLDGAALDQWRPEELGRHTGYLPQSVEVLPGTIAENISRFDPQPLDSDIIAAAKIAGVHEMILAFPDGYSTVIGRQAQPLSSGQIQQLGLARAVYRLPKLVVLDEPNSNLDIKGDEAMSAAIQALRDNGSVVIVMAHRPSALVSLNKVLMLRNGRVAYFGDKEGLAGASKAAAPGPRVVSEGKR